ncbi:MAG: cupredoxin domain-containing protein [Sporichthyaceae bacterium]
MTRLAATALVAGTGLLLTGAGSAAAAEQPANAPASISPAAYAGTIAFNAPSAKAAATKVPIEKNAFTVKDLTVAVGQVVTWTNLDTKPHSVNTTKAPERFDSPLFKQGESWSYTFKTVGAYDYYCAVHPDMLGKVTVVEKAAPPAKSPKAKKPKAEKPAESAAKPAASEAESAHSMHGDNDKSAAPAGTSDNGAPAAAAPQYAPAADPASGAVDPFMKHLEVAHFQRTPAGQAQDIAEFDSWAKAHQALFRTMLDYEVGRNSVAGGAPALGTFLQHMDAAHWNTSPMEQASAIANFDSWNKSHLAMFRQMFDGEVGRSSALGSAPGIGVFMQHLDAAHWNQSANEQANAIADDPAEWTSSHGALFQAMLASFGSGQTPGA